MYLSRFALFCRRALACAVIVGCSGVLASAPVQAAPSDAALISRCNREYIGLEAQSVMLALKATQYCVGQKFPYTEVEVLARLDKLRCDAGASNMIDELNHDYDKQYRLILTQDKTQTVCKHAATLHIK